MKQHTSTTHKIIGPRNVLTRDFKHKMGSQSESFKDQTLWDIPNPECRVSSDARGAEYLLTHQTVNLLASSINF